MKSTHVKLPLGAAAIAVGIGCATLAMAAGWSYQQIADALHAVMESDRTVYTRLIVNRLQNHSETSQKNTLYEKRAKYIAKRIEILEEQMHKARQIDEGLSKRLEKLNCDHRN